MANIVMRVIKILLLCFILAYLTVVAVLNLPPLRNEIQQTVETQLDRPITQGYIYLNWRLNPVVSHVEIEDASRPEFLLVVNNIEFNIDWKGLVEIRRRPGLADLLKDVHAGYLSLVTGPTPEVEEPIDFDLPEFPIKIDFWETDYRVTEEINFQFSGGEIIYDPGEQIVKTEITEFQGKEVKAAGRIELKPDLQADFEVIDFGIPMGLFARLEDRWSGKITYRREADQFKLNADMRGKPVRIEQFQLPELEMTAEITSSGIEEGVLLEKLNLRSGYLQSSWFGYLVDMDGNMDVEGSWDWDPAATLERAKIPEPLPFELKESDLLTGRLKLSGKPFDPTVEGNVKLASARGIWLTAAGDEIDVLIEAIEGEFVDDRLLWRQGRAKFPGAVLELEDGYLRPDQQGIAANLIGALVGIPGEQAPSLVEPLTGFLGEMNQLSLPFNASVIAGAEGLQMAAAVRQGGVHFSRGNFADIWMVASYNSLQPEATSLSGRFTGPFGNSWTIEWLHQRPLRFAAESVRVRPDYQLFPRVEEAQRLINISGAAAEFQFNSPGEDWFDYEGNINFSDGEIEMENIHLSGLQGNVRIEPGYIDLSNLNIQRQPGEVILTGGIRHAPGFEDAAWELSVEVSDLSAGDFGLDEEVISFAEGSGSFQMEGELAHPVFTGQLRANYVKWHNLRVDSPRVLFERVGGATSLRVVEGQVADGNLQGFVSFSLGEWIDIDLALTGISVENLPEGMDPFQGEVTGKVSIRSNLAGPTDDLDQWRGEIIIDHADLMMAEFPVVGGLEHVANIEVIGKDLLINASRNVFPVSGGIIDLDNLRLESENVTLRGEGTLKLTGEIDSSYYLILRGPAIRRYLQDVLGEIYRQIGIGRERTVEIKFDVVGKIPDVEVNVDRQAVRRDFRENLVRNILSDVLGRPVEEILRFFMD